MPMSMKATRKKVCWLFEVSIVDLKEKNNKEKGFDIYERVRAAQYS